MPEHARLLVMPGMADAAPILRLRLTLLDCQAPVWRRLELEAETPLPDVHRAIRRRWAGGWRTSTSSSPARPPRPRPKARRRPGARVAGRAAGSGRRAAVGTDRRGGRRWLCPRWGRIAIVPAPNNSHVPRGAGEAGGARRTTRRRCPRKGDRATCLRGRWSSAPGNRPRPAPSPARAGPAGVRRAVAEAAGGDALPGVHAAVHAGERRRRRRASRRRASRRRATFELKH